MKRTIDINADMGEVWGVYAGPQQVWRAEWDRDETVLGPAKPLTGSDIDRILNVVSSVNLACGFHAGDPLAIKRYVQECVKRNLAIGAHVSYPDPSGFGNRSMSLSRPDLIAVIQYQLAALDGMVRMTGVSLRHVKLHGALYHDANTNPEVAETVYTAVAEYNPVLAIYGLPNGPLWEICRANGLHYACEGFPDRGYANDGSLLPRSQAAAMILDPEQIAKRATEMIIHGRLSADDSSTVVLDVDTLCIHPDTSGASEAAEYTRQMLESYGIVIAPVDTRKDEEVSD